MFIILNILQILYYNNFDVDISGQEIIQDYKVKEFDLTNLHPDTKYLICFRVTRKRFLSLDLSNNETVTVKPPLLLRSNITKALDRNSSINKPYLRNIVLEKTGSASQLIFNDNSSLNRSHRLHSINIPKMNDEYVAEMKCQVTFTQFLHWTAILCSLIGIIVALILSIIIFLVLKSRAYRTKHHDRKMFLNQKGQLSARRIGSGEDEEDGEDMSNANKLRHPHNHPHHHHHHHHHPHSAHHHHHCHHVPHPHNQNQHHAHYHCHLNSSKKSLVKPEHSTRCANHQKTKSSSSSSLSSPSCLKSSDKTGIIRDKSSRHNLTTTEVVCETHSMKPNNNNNTNELHLSEKQLEDWENELKNIEESNDTVTDNTKKSIPVVKPPDVVKNNICIPSVNSVKTQKTSQTIQQDSVTLLESIESVKEMETKRTVSFKDDTPVQINQNPLKKDVHLTNMTSTHSTSFDSHSDDMYNLSKPISISARESHLIHSRHHIPENLISDGNNDSLLFNSKHSINKQVSVNKNLSYSSNNKDYNKKYEICSPLLSDIEQKPQSPSIYDKNQNDFNTPLIPNSSNIQGVTTLVPSVQNPSTTGRKLATPTTTTDNNILLSTSTDSRKNFLENDKNWLLTTKESSNLLIGQNEQKSIFHTQLIETL
ncbi:unnamed protein product [Trichobilharzia szidati]|nr:unnamed protein product [Trichobilharzia szidati]